VGDLAIVRAMLAGDDVRAACLALLRERLGDSTVRLEEARGSSSAVEVTADSRSFGWLVGDTASTQAIAQHAEWLASWLVLHGRLELAHHEAEIDALTGAYNRRYFDRFLAEALDDAKTHRHTVTILYFDIDNLKHFNDAYGHDAGDEVLRETVRLLRSVIRPSDRVCRVGGDEFVVIFHEPTGPREPNSKPPESIQSIAARFQAQIRSHHFPKLAEGAPGRLTISGGLATFPWDGRTPEDLIRVADQLTLQSKRRGKNVIIIGEGAARAERQGLQQ
jgi:diguanylate cyclase (GGDEF)-like protein